MLIKSYIIDVNKKSWPPCESLYYALKTAYQLIKAWAMERTNEGQSHDRSVSGSDFLINSIHLSLKKNQCCCQHNLWRFIHFATKPRNFIILFKWLDDGKLCPPKMWVCITFRVLIHFTLFKGIYKPSVVRATTICRIMRYYYLLSLGFSCIIWFYIWMAILWYGYSFHVTLCIGQLHTITVYRTVCGRALFCLWVFVLFF